MALPDETRQRLLDAAGQEFAAKGRDQTTVRDILKRAGMKNQAAVNYYFDSKDKLYEAVMHDTVQCQDGHLPMQEWPAEMPAEEKLRAFIQGMAKHMLVTKQPWQLRLILRELVDPSPGSEAFVRDFLKPIYQTLWAILRELLGPEVPEDKLHLIGFSIAGQVFYHRVARHFLAQVVGPKEYATFDADCLAEHVAEFSLAALAHLSAGEEVQR